MALLLTVLEIAAPVFLLTSIGFFWIKAGFEYRIDFVTQIAMTLSVPCLIFVSLMRTEIAPNVLGALSLATLAAYGAVTLFMVAIVFVLRLERRTYLAPLIFGNTGNLGLPLAYFAFGETGLGYSIVVFAIMIVWFSTFGIWVVAGGGSPFKVLREPFMWATLLGALFMWQGWETPLFLTNTLELVGQLAIPLMLITLGVAMARLDVAGIKRAIFLSVFKLVICTACAFMAGWIFALDPVALGVLVVQVATPVAVVSYLVAEKYNANAQAVAGLVVVSTLMSVAALPFLLAVFL